MWGIRRGSYVRTEEPIFLSFARRASSTSRLTSCDMVSRLLSLTKPFLRTIRSMSLRASAALAGGRDIVKVGGAVVNTVQTGARLDNRVSQEVRAWPIFCDY